MKVCSTWKDNYQHQTIHSITPNFHLLAVIGMTKEQFNKLFNHLYCDIQELFPHCPMEMDSGDTYQFCENRMKLFMFLYRLKNGCSFGHMSSLFGWSKSSIEEWCDSVHNESENIGRNRRIVMAQVFGTTQVLLRIMLCHSHWRVCNESPAD